MTPTAAGAAGPDPRREAPALLESGLNPYVLKLSRRLLDALAAEFAAEGGAGGLSGAAAAPALAARWAEVLRGSLARDAARLTALRKLHRDFTSLYLAARGEEERRERILDFARELGADAATLRGDRRAFGRWFGADAVNDRWVRRFGRVERRMAFCLGRLGEMARLALAPPGAAAGAGTTWRRLGLEETAGPLLAHDGDVRVRSAALACLSTGVRALPSEARAQALGDGVLSFVYRAALDRRQNVWLQCEALNLLRVLSGPDFVKIAGLRLAEPGGGDDLFVRARVTRYVGEEIRRCPEPSRMPHLAGLLSLLGPAAEDASPFVRQEAARALTAAPEETVRAALPRLARGDAAPAVRAAALVAGRALLGRAELLGDLLAVLVGALAEERDEFVLRVAIRMAGEWTRELVEGGSPALPAWRARVLAGLEQVHTGSACLPARRWAAQARERILVDTDERARALRGRLEEFLRALPPGEIRRLPDELAAAAAGGSGADWGMAGRVLSVLAQEDYGIDLERRRRGVWATRGPVFGWRAWRWLHEMLHPSPDKRQAFRHTVGRATPADLRAPSAILAELAQTKVPGEPLFLPGEGGWRPYLPLPDDFVSALDPSVGRQGVRFCTSEGITEVAPPPTWVGRLRAWFALTWGFARLARLRNWREGDLARPSSYVEACAGLGFGIRYRPYGEDEGGASPEDPSVRRFFAPAVVLVLDPGLWQHMQEYFVSVYENSLSELAIFVAAAMAYFVGKHLWANVTFRRARARIPLVLGGWGTRGKSGTERLKGALLSALGYGIFSKTTGCEAMFLLAHPFAATREMFLFRPYDKATIWEQRDVVRLAARLEVDAFLWECMALQPNFVHMLQHHWMRDDLSTVTNTYPDHEDIQGPAGINVPEVIARFLPPAARAFTSEELMLPIVKRRAEQVETRLSCVGWLEAGLLAPDVVKRFPYEEHPYNLALVLGVAGELGVEGDFALKEMADRVVPDLGVLKTTALARRQTRRLEFANGMSANERHGCVSNWIRLGFDQQDADAEPGVWLTTVVNNRADRIPRSQVFAGVVVNDCRADRTVLIGGNLNGLMEYIRESWGTYAAGVTLWPEAEVADNERAGRILTDLARRFRLPTTEERVRARRAIMEGAVAGEGAGLVGKGAGGRETVGGADIPSPQPSPAAAGEGDGAGAGGRAELAAAAAGHHEREVKALGEFVALAARVAGAGREQRAEVDGAVRAYLRDWFFARILVVQDYYATGDQIIHRIAQETPPGFKNRVMGIQNIKGTGLDFVYRWLAWDACYRMCERLKSADPAEAEAGLAALASFQEYGVLCEEHVRETLDQVRRSPFAQREGVAAQLELIGANFARGMEALKKKLAASSAAAADTGWAGTLIGWAETLLDVGDAVKRRKRANRVYEDLAEERIGQERAVVELQALTKRQKGGWLRAAVAALRERYAADGGRSPRARAEGPA